MMGPRRVEQAALFYNFSLEAHVPDKHILRSIDRFVVLSDLRGQLAPSASAWCVIDAPNLMPTASSAIAHRSSTATSVHSSHGAAPPRKPARCHAQSTRAPAILPAPSRKRTNGLHRDVSAKRSRCCSLTSNAFCGWIDCDCEGRAVPATSSTLQLLLRTCVSSQS